MKPYQDHHPVLDKGKARPVPKQPTRCSSKPKKNQRKPRAFAIPASLKPGDNGGLVNKGPRAVTVKRMERGGSKGQGRR